MTWVEHGVFVFEANNSHWTASPMTQQETHIVDLLASALLDIGCICLDPFRPRQARNGRPGLQWRRAIALVDLICSKAWNPDDQTEAQPEEAEASYMHRGGEDRDFAGARVTSALLFTCAESNTQNVRRFEMYFVRRPMSHRILPGQTLVWTPRAEGIVAAIASTGEAMDLPRHAPAPMARGRGTDCIVQPVRVGRSPASFVRLGRLRWHLGQISRSPRNPEEAREAILRALARACLSDWTIPALDDPASRRCICDSYKIQLLAHAILINPWGAFRIVDLHESSTPYFELCGYDRRPFRTPIIEP